MEDPVGTKVAFVSIGLVGASGMAGASYYFKALALDAESVITEANLNILNFNKIIWWNVIE